MSRFDAGGKGLDEELTLDDENRYLDLLKSARNDVRERFEYSNKPALNNASDVLDALEGMNKAQWDSVFFLLELIFETSHSDQRAMHYDALGRVIGRHVVGDVERQLESEAMGHATSAYFEGHSDG